MTVTIKRTEIDEYRLLSSDGSEIEIYQQATMRHPDDWIQDARDAGEEIHGPYDWEYVDARQ